MRFRVICREEIRKKGGKGYQSRVGSNLMLVFRFAVWSFWGHIHELLLLGKAVQVKAKLQNYTWMSEFMCI